MREILFKGKHKRTGEWVEGTGILFDGINTWLVRNKDNQPIKFGETYDFIDPETVGQYTGLTDKNGAKIFEGDLIQTQRKKASFIFVIKYGEYTPLQYCKEIYQEQKTIGFYAFDGKCDFQMSNCSHLLEVIGNIHDNPELLKGGV